MPSDLIAAASLLAAATGPGNDTVEGGDVPLFLHGWGGDDDLTGSEWNDTLFGDAGNDSLFGGFGNDVLYGGTGNDLIYGGYGTDTLTGGNGADSLYGGGGGPGKKNYSGLDWLLYTGETAAVHVDFVTGKVGFASGAAADTVDFVECAETGAGNDVFVGDTWANRFKGGAGDDSFTDLSYNNTFDGGTGRDTVLYLQKTSAVVVNLGGLTAGTTDDLISIENAVGGSASDHLGGSAAANILRGSGGADTLIGGGSSDTLAGGTGGDRFVFKSGDSAPGSADWLVAGDGGPAFDGPGAKGGDKIDLAAIDAVAGGANDAFTWGGLTQTGKGHLWIAASGTNTVVRGNTDADAAPELEIVIADGTVSPTAYSAADFIL